VPLASWVSVVVFLLLLLFSWAIYLTLVIYSANSDGATPPPAAAATWLAIGGAFAGVRANYSAQWDGSAWAPLEAAAGVGLNGPVHALAMLDGRLYAGGSFTVPAPGGSSSAVAVWDGQQWAAVGAGLIGPVWALAVVNGTLWAGGDLSAPLLSYVARWNATAGAWASAPLDPSLDGPVYTLADHNGRLVVGGAFATYLTQWDGVAWGPVGNGAAQTAPVYALAVDAAAPATLYVGGQDGLARWDGAAWTRPLGGTGGGVNGTVYALAARGTDTAGVCAATQDGADTAAVPSRVLCWDGAAWGPPTAAVAGRVRALAVFRDTLVAGGEFTAPVPYLAQWSTASGTAWAALGPASDLNGAAYAVLPSATRLV
jgi:trimeric autotransporter adhesin